MKEVHSFLQNISSSHYIFHLQNTVSVRKNEKDKNIVSGEKKDCLTGSKLVSLFSSRTGEAMIFITRYCSLKECGFP